MSVKAIQAKVVCSTPRLRDYLWLTHRLFNEALAFAIKEMLAMKHGAKGPLAHRLDAATAEKFRAIYCDMMHERCEVNGTVLHPDEAENKKKREGRSQSAHAWMELITNKASKRDSRSKTIAPEIIRLIGELLEREQILFERDAVWLFGGDSNGFRRLLFDMAARRIITNVQNEENHQRLKAECELKFAEWKSSERTNFAEFEKVLPLFRAYEDERRKQAQANVRHAVRGEVRIDGAMTKGWRELKELLVGAENDPSEATKRIKHWQGEDPKAVGDINFFHWLADKPQLWPWGDTVRRYNGFVADLHHLSRPVNFSYPRADERPEWFTFSESSPGHMYDFDAGNVEFGNLLAYLRGEAPLKVRLVVFVPNEDAARWKEIEKKRKSGTAINDADVAFLKKPIQWADFESATERIPQSVRGFFRTAWPLDLAKFSRCWVEFELKPDARWRECVRYVGKGRRAKRGKEKGDTEAEVFEFNWGFNAHDPIWRRIHKFGGAKLIYPGQLSRGVSPARLQPFLYFSFEIEPAAEPKPEWSVKFSEKNGDVGLAPADKAKKKTSRTTKPPKLPEGLRVMAIDLGMRHLAIGTICEVKNGKLIEWRSRNNGRSGLELANLVTPPLFLKLPGLELRDLQRHEWEKKDLQRETAPRGHLRRGEDFAVGLTEHLDAMKDDRAKKAAHIIVEAAWQHGVHWIVFENLTGYRPEQELTRDVNSRLRLWNRRHIVEQVKQVASNYGIRVYDYAAPAYTSRVCAVCGNVGARFSEITAQQERRDSRFKTPKGLQTGRKQVLNGGQMFACLHCQRIVNADYNGSLNLHRRFERSFDFAERYDIQRSGSGDMTYFYANQRLVGKEFWSAVAADVQRFLNTKFKQGDLAPAGGWPKAVNGNEDIAAVSAESDDDIPFEFPPAPRTA